MRATAPRDVAFNSLKKLKSRFAPGEKNRISVDAQDVPGWQRQVVWNADEMGLLAYSIIANFPIGMMILWKKDDGVRVPIDGRQRLVDLR